MAQAGTVNGDGGNNRLVALSGPRTLGLCMIELFLAGLLDDEMNFTAICIRGPPSGCTLAGFLNGHQRSLRNPPSNSLAMSLPGLWHSCAREKYSNGGIHYMRAS